MRTLFVTYRGTASDRFDREYFVNTHLPLAREIAEPLGMLAIEAFFPTSTASNIVAASVIVLRDEQAVSDLFSSPRFGELVNDLPNYTNLMPEQSLVAHLSA
jgi:uncharacterized protein (TIGR02118 family)